MEYIGEDELLADSPFSRLNLRNLAFVYEALLFLDSIEHQWNMWVVGYDGKVQASYLKKLLGEVSATRLGLVILGASLLALAVVAPLILLRRRRARPSSEVRAFRDLCVAFSRAGVVREASDPPSVFQTRITARHPGLAEQAGQAIGLVNRLLYNPDPGMAGEDLSELKRLVAQLKRRIWRLRVAAQ